MDPSNPWADSLGDICGTQPCCSPSRQWEMEQKWWAKKMERAVRQAREEDAAEAAAAAAAAAPPPPTTTTPTTTTAAIADNAGPKFKRLRGHACLDVSDN